MKPKITLNPDEKIVEMIKQGLKEKGGYCPCRLGKDEKYKCICEEFREQIKDPEFPMLSLQCRKDSLLREII